MLSYLNTEKLTNPTCIPNTNPNSDFSPKLISLGSFLRLSSSSAGDLDGAK